MLPLSKLIQERDVSPDREDESASFETPEVKAKKTAEENEGKRTRSGRKVQKRELFQPAPYQKKGKKARSESELVILQPKLGDVVQNSRKCVLQWQTNKPARYSEFAIQLSVPWQTAKSDVLWPIKCGEKEPPPGERIPKPILAWEPAKFPKGTEKPEEPLMVQVPGYVFEHESYLPDVGKAVAKECEFEIESVRTGVFGRSEKFTVETSEDQMRNIDVGVWCKCGECKFNKTSRHTLWVQCSECDSWQHSECVDYKFEEDIEPGSDDEAEAAEKEEYRCTWCRLDKASDAPIPVQLAMLSNISRSSGYFKLSGLEGLLCRTPQRVQDFLTTMIKSHETCIDLGAGDGGLSGALPRKSVCVELEPNRVAAGRLQYPQMEWLNKDVLTESFLRYVKDRKFSCVVSNPPFEHALEFLYIASLALDPNAPHSRVCFLLPSDFFEGSMRRTRVFMLLNLVVVREYKLGHFDYYEKEAIDSHTKRTCDSFFILKPGRDQSFTYQCVNSRAADDF